MNELQIIQQEKSTGVQVPAQTVASVWRDKEAFDQVARVANMLSKSSIVPENYRNKPEDCFIAVEMASRMNTSPIFIMQNLYVVKGKPSWAGQACMAMIASCGKFKNVKHVYTGTRGTDDRGCYVEATRISDGEILHGTEVTIQMAKAEGWMSNSKWKNMPEQMLGYRAASFFARMFCPEAMMGLQTTEEIYDAQQPVSAVQTAADLKAAIIEDETNKEAPKCEACGKAIVGTASFTPEQLVAASKQKYGRGLCIECGKKAKAELEAKQTEEANAAKAAEAKTEAKAEAETKAVNVAEDLAAQLMATAMK